MLDHKPSVRSHTEDEASPVFPGDLTRGTLGLNRNRAAGVISSPPLFIKFSLAVLTLRFLLLETGLDRLTTLGTWSNPVCLAIGSAFGVAVAVLLALNWFTPPTCLTMPKRTERLKQRSFLAWCVSGAILTIATSAAMAWTCTSLLGVGAQYLDGSPGSFEATVVSQRSAHTAGAICRAKLDVMPTTKGPLLTICLITKYRSSLSTGDLAQGTLVTVHVLDTHLGRVVQSVTPK